MELRINDKVMVSRLWCIAPDRFSRSMCKKHAGRIGTISCISRQFLSADCKVVFGDGTYAFLYMSCLEPAWHTETKLGKLL